MAFTRALFLLLLVSMAALLPLVHSHHPSLQGVRGVSEETASVKRGFERSVGKRFVGGGSFLAGEERQVPTGPDPLHHNDKPTGH